MAADTKNNKTYKIGIFFERLGIFGGYFVLSISRTLMLIDIKIIIIKKIYSGIRSQ